MQWISVPSIAPTLGGRLFSEHVGLEVGFFSGSGFVEVLIECP